jgi:hypothetical protein
MGPDVLVVVLFILASIAAVAYLGFRSRGNKPPTQK